MIEGQEGVGWNQWQAIAYACERSGIPALFRSDHYLPLGADTERQALDAWAVICALAATTKSLRLGTLVSPIGFREPALLAKMVATADHISDGRIELGIGAGWNAPEHEAFGFSFPPVSSRMAALAEQLEIIHGLWADEPFFFSGAHYRLTPSSSLPKPVQRSGVPIIIGGEAGPKSARLAARWADEYNTYYATADICRQRRDQVLAAAAERANEMRFSLMTAAVLGRDRAAVQARLDRLKRDHGREPDSSWIVGTPTAAAKQLEHLAGAGVDRVMLQLLLHDDIEQIELIGTQLQPSVDHR